VLGLEAKRRHASAVVIEELQLDAETGFDVDADVVGAEFDLSEVAASWLGTRNLGEDQWVRVRSGQDLGQQQQHHVLGSYYVYCFGLG
jgi:hypothetical protein